MSNDIINYKPSCLADSWRPSRNGPFSCFWMGASYLRFRLRTCRAAIKRDLARRHADNRPAYTAGKAAMIGEILGRAAPTG